MRNEKDINRYNSLTINFTAQQIFFSKEHNKIVYTWQHEEHIQFSNANDYT